MSREKTNEPSDEMEQASMLSILVADDHPLVRRYVREVLEDENGWRVCAEAATGRDAIEVAVRHRPDIAILDLSMPFLDGLEATRQILQRLPHTQVVILTMHDAEEVTREALASGARACVIKSDLQNLVTAVRHLL
jgi:DNA-binding NarL/FixJ family response regulator